jgi:hypothetical protein
MKRNAFLTGSKGVKLSVLLLSSSRSRFNGRLFAPFAGLCPRAFLQISNAATYLPRSIRGNSI